jgi:hypothetical protein
MFCNFCFYGNFRKHSCGNITDDAIKEFDDTTRLREHMIIRHFLTLSTHFYFKNILIKSVKRYTTYYVMHRI